MPLTRGLFPSGSRERGAASSPTLGNAGRHGAGSGPRLGSPAAGVGARRVPGGPLLFYLSGGWFGNAGKEKAPRRGPRSSAYGRLSPLCALRVQRRKDADPHATVPEPPSPIRVHPCSPRPGPCSSQQPIVRPSVSRTPPKTRGFLLASSSSFGGPAPAPP